jgi:hypothetical protein
MTRALERGIVLTFYGLTQLRRVVEVARGQARWLVIAHDRKRSQ